MRAAHFPTDPSSVRGFGAQPHVGLRQIPPTRITEILASSV